MAPAPPPDRARLESLEPVGCTRREIILRNPRVGVALASQKADHVAAVFAQKRFRIILRVPLREHEVARLAAPEDVYANRLGP